MSAGNLARDEPTPPAERWALPRRPVWRVLHGGGLSEGRVEAVLGRAACLAAGLVGTTDAGPPAGWEDVLPDARLAMACGQSGYLT